MRFSISQAVRDSTKISLVNCSLIENIARSGGGAACHGSNTTGHRLKVYLADLVEIVGNRATSRGGGLFLYQQVDSTMSSAVFKSNSAELSGGAITTVVSRQHNLHSLC